MSTNNGNGADNGSGSSSNTHHHHGNNDTTTNNSAATHPTTHPTTNTAQQPPETEMERNAREAHARQQHADMSAWNRWERHVDAAETQQNDENARAHTLAGLFAHRHGGHMGGAADAFNSNADDSNAANRQIQADAAQRERELEEHRLAHGLSKKMKKGDFMAKLGQRGRGDRGGRGHHWFGRGRGGGSGGDDGAGGSGSNVST